MLNFSEAEALLPHNMEIACFGNRRAFPIYRDDMTVSKVMVYLMVRGIGERPYFGFDWKNDDSFHAAVKEFQCLLEKKADA